jgi:hypothetical protein
MMLASRPAVVAAAVASSPVTTIDAENLPLAVKRVPGSLAGWKIDDLATPYDQPIIAGLRVDDRTVDYWKITLNEGDSVVLSIAAESLPNGGSSPTDFVVRIWGPDNKEILPANMQPVSGTQFTYVAKQVGTYTIGISTSKNASYPFVDPSSPQTRPADTSPSLHVYTATFSTYPGPNTNLMNILQTYTSNWPTLTGDDLTAYSTLTMIASQASNVEGTGIIDFSGSFEQVGNATIDHITGWLTNTWAPFQAILVSNNKLETATNIYNDGAFKVINVAYPTLSDWLKVAEPFITDQKLQDAYSKIDGLLVTANQDRSNIDTFLRSLSHWSLAYQVLVGTRPTTIEQDLTQGLTNVPEMPKPVQQWGWLKTLIGSLVNLIAGAVGVATANPGAGLATSFLLNAIANPIDAYLDGNFEKKPPPPDSTNTSTNIAKAADDMEAFSQTTFLDTFQLLTSPKFESSLFSNYGLLQAMEHVRFSYSASGDPTLARMLLDNYDTTVWQQLLPRMFKWQILPFTDNGPTNTLRNFTFFVPSSESAEWSNPDELPPVNDSCCPGDTTWLSKEWSLPGGRQEMAAEAKSELLQLQAGATFHFGGHDFTPERWFGPGPISWHQLLTGNSSTFYTITANSHIDETLYRHDPQALAYWKTWATLEGDTIQEWALVTHDGKREMSQAAADLLFGTGSLELASPDPIYSPNKDDSSYTYNFKVQSGGLATRFDVFTQWGQGVPDFSPHSFQPAKSSGEMSVDPNPNGRYGKYFDNMYADYTLTYGSKPSMTPPKLLPSGYGDGIDAFVTTLYREQLGRNPDRPGLLFWAGRLASAMKPLRVAKAIWGSTEHQALLKQGTTPPISLARSFAGAVRAGSHAKRSWRVTPRGPRLNAPRVATGLEKLRLSYDRPL